MKSLALLVLAGSLVAFTAWVALSSLWTPSLTSTAHEVQRCLAYTGLVGSALLLVRRATATHLLGGAARSPLTHRVNTWSAYSGLAWRF